MTEEVMQENANAVEQTTQEENTSQEAQSLLGEQPAPDNKWYFADGYEGTGDAPEWFKADKYKSVSEQARAYTELEKKFGSFTGAPKDGYQLPEGLDSEDALVQEVMKFGAEHQMSQAGFDQMMELALAQAQATEQISVENEMAKLGSNANDRIKRVDGFLRNNLESEKYQEIAPLMTTADTIKLAETFISLTSQSKLPIDEVVTSEGVTMEQYQIELMRKDENGNYLMNTSQDHAKKMRRWKAELEKQAG